MRLFEIRHRWTNTVLFSREAASVRRAIEAAVASKANLEEADLRGANLQWANLDGANLRGAHLQEANLYKVNLDGANLSGANLDGANLRGANLQGANLYEVNLDCANLCGAKLQPIRDDLWAVLAASPGEVAGLRQALVDGRIDGSAYDGDCACLVGTLANVRGCDIEALPHLRPDAARLAERWFLNLHPGDTPGTSTVARQTLEWIDTFLDNMRAAFGPAEGKSHA